MPTTASYEFNGTASQGTLGLPATVNALTINNAVGTGVTLGAATTVTTLTIGDVTTNSIFYDGGRQVSSGGTLNLISGTFKLGNGTGTNFPGFVTRNISTGTTIDYGAAVSQTISAINYANLANTGNGSRTLASSGTIGISEHLHRAPEAILLQEAQLISTGPELKQLMHSVIITLP